MAILALAVFVAAHAAQAKVTPLEKVVTLLKDLQTQVTEDGTKEATTYDTFACFCKSKQSEKSTAISEAETAVDGLVSDLSTYTADRNQLDLDIQGLNADILEYEEQLKTADEMRKEEKNTFALAFEDMTKAVSSLERAIDTLKASESVSMMTVGSIVHKSVVMADALGFADNKNKVVAALLQEDPSFEDTFGDSDLTAGNSYDFASGDIISTLEGLLSTFRDKKTQLESDDVSAEDSYAQAKQAKEDQLKTARETLATKQDDKSAKVKDIATAQADLTERNAVLNDDRVYLQDLSTKCEVKAKEWDQRSDMRSQELAAITQALSVLEGKVAEEAGATGEGGRSLVSVHSVVDKAATEADDDDDDDDDDVSFTQVSAQVRHAQNDAKPKSVADKKVQKVAALLAKMGSKLRSAVLSSLAVKVREDPFAKVKTLIQDLIERLLQQEADEANHKGWCDTEISKTLKDRDYRLRDVAELHETLEGLNARHGVLVEQISDLTTEIDTLTGDLANQTALRADEKTEHETTIADGKEGETAIKEAIDILSHFYGAAAKAFVQAGDDPDAEMPDAGFSGNYTGSQSASTGILGIMEVILGDFQRTIKETTAAEEQAVRDFIEYERETKMSQTTKTTAKEALEHEKTENDGELQTAEEGLRTQQQLLDGAVEQWEKLLPGCVADPGMSAEERAAKRDEEIAALKDAYCILSDQDPGCSGIFLQKKASLRGA
jgi:chromosome segregation ATPase